MLEKYPGNVKLVMKMFPLRSHPFARSAAIGAMAAHRQMRFWEYHDGLFRNLRTMSEETVISTARELGLDMDRFEKDRRDLAVQAAVDRDVAEGARIGVRGTPAVFINGQKVGQRSLGVFSSMIEEELAREKTP